MNFTTDLPKNQPLVTYIVASAVRCEKFFPDCEGEGPCYRMHAVILKDEGKDRIYQFALQIIYLFKIRSTENTE